MKKFIAFIFLFVVSAQTAFATDVIGQVPQSAFGDSAVLITNPFYGSKAFFSGVKSWFISDPLSRMQFNMDAMNDKASEVATLIQVAPDNKIALAATLAEYQRSAIVFHSYLNRFLSSQYAASHWQFIADELNLHATFIDDLLMTASDNSSIALLLSIQSSITTDMVTVLLSTGRVQTWIEQMTTPTDEPEFVFSDLRTAERLRELADTAIIMNKAAVAQLLDEAAGGLMAQIAARIAGQLAIGDELVISDLGRVSGYSRTRVRSLEIMIDQEPVLYNSQELADLVAKLSAQ